MGQGGTGMMGPGMMNQGMMGPGTCSMMGGIGQGMMMGWGMMNPAMMGMMMGGPAAQGRLAYMKAELGITDAQTAAGTVTRVRSMRRSPACKACTLE